MCYYCCDRKKPLFPTQSWLRSPIIGPTRRWRIPSHFNVIHTGSEFCHHCACRYHLSRYNADHNLGLFVKVSFDIYYFDQAPCNQMSHSKSWWRHQMEAFSALLVICAGNSPVTSEFPAQRSVTRGFDVFFDLLLNKRLSKQSRGWWFETPSFPLWRHCNDGLTSYRDISQRLQFIYIYKVRYAA